MKIPDWLPCYGDQSFRGKCPAETAEQVTFFARLRREYPDSYGILGVHPRNEQQLRGGQFRALDRQKAEGMSPGASDIVIPGKPAFVCELKRQDRTQCRWQDGQLEYLRAAMKAGAFACVALGVVGAWEAFRVWVAQQGEPE